ncbi:fumarylacetoacetate hydrolase family protein [Methylococcus capsulatus]|uniref:Fumarylacetoacetate hydrolase family protein n=1 Tax=Methylococcus capsulatus (strain ATCC 33009 / NCIMB 11132 / Bath) TaxID=243233 RepID=Q60C48_METCA|nr:fumarylacetoacetate hydrolase family protein [Methylococcus capsulatus]AAU90538.1 fumarylacetoacetate hydrolase family protein [Methylococcus capsulatus str. Bath]QXP89722.1 fumarylacetoacetate hydrolase family protein [Methylococcus capsulatus]
MNYAFPPAPVITLDAMSSRPFPVRRIFCLAHNYPESGREAVKPAEPGFFLKPAGAILQNNAVLPYPPGTGALCPEAEMVVALHKGGRNIPADRVDHEYMFGYAVGLDMTLRDALDHAIAQGLPWDKAKSFDHSSPCSAITPEFYAGNIASGRIELKVNGEVRQSGNVADMLWKVPETVHYLSTRMELFPGDLIYTGSSGLAGPVFQGDVIEATVAGLEPLIITIG